MEVTYIVSRQDLRRCTEYLVRGRAGCLFGLLWMTCCVLTASLVVVVSVSTIPDKETFLLVIVMALLALPFVLRLALGAMTFLAVLKALASSSGRSCAIRLNSDGVCQLRPEGETFTAWTQIAWVLEHQQDIYFGRARASFFVPRTAFASPEQAQAFLEAARKYWKNPGGPDETVWPPPPRRS